MNRVTQMFTKLKLSIQRKIMKNDEKCNWLKIKSNLGGMVSLESQCGVVLGLVISDKEVPNYRYTLEDNGLNYCFKCGKKIKVTQISIKDNLKLTKDSLEIKKENDDVIIFPNGLYDKVSNITLPIKNIVDFEKLDTIEEILSSVKNLDYFDTHFKKSTIKDEYLHLKISNLK